MAREFYATIQNKFHYAITKNTAAEIIYNRADSNKENMGLTNWKESPNGKILKSDVTIAKNYLSEIELKNLNNVLSVRHYEILDGKGKISKKQADEKAENEYEKYKVIQDKKFLSDFDILMLEAENINKSKQIN